MTNNKCILDFQNPGTLSEELTHVPGFIDELTEYTLSQAHSPNRILAFLGATAMLAHLTGRSYVDAHGTRTNIYVVALGDTGIGKDAARRTNRKLADAIGITDQLCDQLSSGEALEELMAKNPSLLFMPDEVESFAGAMHGRGKNAVRLSERIRRLYSASAGCYAVRSTARVPKGALVEFPHISLFGTGTPEAFYNAIDAASIVNGLFGRCLVVNANDEYRSNLPCETPIPSQVVEVARFLALRERRIRETGTLNLMTVQETEAARTMLLDSANKTMEMRKELSERELPTARALVVRMNEKIAKLAMLYAISANAETPMITPDAVRWAAEFVVHVTHSMLYEAQFHIAEGKFDSQVKRTISFLNKRGGSADRSTLLRYLKIDAHTMKKIISTLMMADVIEIEEISGGKVVYSLNYEQ